MTGARWSRIALWHWLRKRRLAWWGCPRIEPLWLPIWLSLGTERMRKVLWLWLALRLLAALLVPWRSGIAIRGRSIILALLIHGPLLVERRALVGPSARIVLLRRAPIVAIHRLAHWGSALHHVGCLRRHGGCAVGDSHLGLRGHCLGAAGHGRTGAEDVCECGVPCSSGLLAILRARILPPLLLVAVVGHGASSIAESSGLRAHPQLVSSCGRLGGGGVSGPSSTRAGEDSGTAMKGTNM